MSLLDDVADSFKANRVPIERWYRDGEGRFAFRVTVDDTRLVVAARKSAAGDRIGCMVRVATKAASVNGLVCLQYRNDRFVFDPRTILNHGDIDTVDADRRSRGEEWVDFPIGFGADFESWVDGYDDPVAFGDVGDY